jgi:hypothetical protein
VRPKGARGGLPFVNHAIKVASRPLGLSSVEGLVIVVYDYSDDVKARSHPSLFHDLSLPSKRCDVYDSHHVRRCWCWCDVEHTRGA